ncbi:MAG: hypothetical protein Q9P14_05860 [candidate division KSB1 bacterium]|nr:hypothetical protein [candidate division KSB1 bacterium]MDQ7064249.1 hypothetical protein [candidate division KSB1 bacterium]
MNQRTVRLLNDYARLVNKKPREIRKWWNSLSWKDRSRERERILKELEGEISQESES